MAVDFLLAYGQCPAPASIWEWREAGQEVKSGSLAHLALFTPSPSFPGSLCLPLSQTSPQAMEVTQAPHSNCPNLWKEGEIRAEGLAAFPK